MAGKYSLRFFIGREKHPDEHDRGELFLFLKKPTKGEYGNGKYWFWSVKDPSNKIRMSAGVSFMLSSDHKRIQKGELLCVLGQNQ